MSQWSHQCHQCHQCGSRLSSLAVFMHSIALLSVLTTFCAVQYAFGEAPDVKWTRRSRFKDNVLLYTCMQRVRRLIPGLGTCAVLQPWGDNDPTEASQWDRRQCQRCPRAKMPYAQVNNAPRADLVTCTCVDPSWRNFEAGIPGSMCDQEGSNCRTPYAGLESISRISRLDRPVYLLYCSLPT